VLLYALYAICAIAVVALGFAAWLAGRAFPSMPARALAWGLWLALVFTPMSAAGGNGTLAGTPILAFATLLLGGDPAYALAALSTLLVSAPICIGLAWFVLRQWKVAGEEDEAAKRG
jgi:hypothetical protein